MLGAGQPPRAGQRDVDGLGLERRVGWAGARSLLEQPLHQFLEQFEALTHRPSCLGRRGLQPAVGNFVEQALLAPQPLQTKCVGLERSRILARLFLQRGKCLAQRGIVKIRQIGNWIVHHA